MYQYIHISSKYKKFLQNNSIEYYEYFGSVKRLKVWSVLQ